MRDEEKREGERWGLEGRRKEEGRRGERREFSTVAGERCSVSSRYHVSCFLIISVPADTSDVT